MHPVSCSAATALLFACGAATDFMFLSMADWLGSNAFLVYAFLAALSATYVHLYLPETKGRSLSDVQALILAQTKSNTPTQSYSKSCSDWLSKCTAFVLCRPSRSMAAAAYSKFHDEVEIEMEELGGDSASLLLETTSTGNQHINQTQDGDPALRSDSP